MSEVTSTRSRLAGPEVGAAIRTVSAHFQESPRSAQITDRPATATLESGLRCRVTGPDDWQLTTDMHPTLGGAGTAAYPSWVLRAAAASCVATTIAMRAGVQELTLRHLEVHVGSDTDLRGMLGVGDPATSAPSVVRVDVTIDADAPAAALDELVRWAVLHSPVGATVAEPVPVSITSPHTRRRSSEADGRAPTTPAGRE